MLFLLVSVAGYLTRSCLMKMVMKCVTLGRIQLNPYSNCMVSQMIYKLYACLPSFIEQHGLIGKFLCEYTTETSVHLAFSSFLRNFIDSFHVETVIFQAGNETWGIPAMDDATRECHAFAQLCEDLMLGAFDHVMIAITTDKKVRIVIFCTSNGAERILD